MYTTMGPLFLRSRHFLSPTAHRGRRRPYDIDAGTWLPSFGCWLWPYYRRELNSRKQRYFLPRQLRWPALKGMRYLSSLTACAGSIHRSGTYKSASSPNIALSWCSAWFTMDTAVCQNQYFPKNRSTPPGMSSSAISLPPGGTTRGSGILKAGLIRRVSLIQA